MQIPKAAIKPMAEASSLRSLISTSVASRTCAMLPAMLGVTALILTDAVLNAGGPAARAFFLVC